MQVENQAETIVTNVFRDSCGAAFFVSGAPSIIATVEVGFDVANAGFFGTKIAGLICNEWEQFLAMAPHICVKRVAKQLVAVLRS